MNRAPGLSKERVRPRIVAIDALRGFDMFWITGGLPLFLAGCRLFAEPLPAWLLNQATHRAWIGFSAWDLIMPLFLFVVGAVMPFSFSKYDDTGARNYKRIYGHILKRVLLLFALGMVAQGNLLTFDPGKIKLFCNTLQAIAGGYLISAVALLHLGNKGRMILFAVLLLAYWGLLRFVPFGGNPGGTLEAWNNFALYWDKLLQGSMQDGTNYTWITTQLAFGAMVLGGVFGGMILKASLSHGKKILSLLGAGGAGLLLGWLWSFDLEIIKHLFTSSMVLWAAGWCYLLLALFYFLTDVCKWSKLFFPFQVIGSNAILAYMWVMVCSPEGNISRALFGGFSQLWGGAGEFIFQLLNYLFIWSILYLLYRKKIFLKV